MNRFWKVIGILCVVVSVAVTVWQTVVNAGLKRQLADANNQISNLRATAADLKQLNRVEVAPMRVFATGFAALTLYTSGDQTLVCGETRRSGSARSGFEESQNAAAEVLTTFMVDRNGRDIGVVVRSQ